MSELNLFRRCRRHWWLDYYRGLVLKDEPLSGPLRLGQRLHRALEAYYKNGFNSFKLWELWGRDTHEGELRLAELGHAIDSEQGMDYRHDTTLGRIMLEGFLTWSREEGIDEHYEVEGVEGLLKYEITPDVCLVGKYDVRLTRRIDGTKLIRDFKSVASLNDPISDLHEQPMMYLLLERLMTGQRAAGFSFVRLRKVKRTSNAKPPFYGEEVILYNDETLRSFWYRLHGMIRDLREVEKALNEGANPLTVVYPTPRRDCSWDCPHLLACPLFDDGSHVEEFIERYYEPRPPYERYEDLLTRVYTVTE